MRSSLDYAGFAQLCGRSPIMREIMRAHNRIIPRSLEVSALRAFLSSRHSSALYCFTVLYLCWGMEAVHLEGVQEPELQVGVLMISV